MNAVLPVILFVLTRVVPALFRVAVAATVQVFVFVEAHHAAILACLSWIGTQVVADGSALLPYARAALAYFATSAAAGIFAAARCVVRFEPEAQAFVAVPLVDLREVLAEEWARLTAAYRSLFTQAAAAPEAGYVTPPKITIKDGAGKAFASVEIPPDANAITLGRITPAPDYAPKTPAS